MSFLKSLLNKEEPIHQDWQVLDQLNQVEDIIAQSFHKPTAIFKHSLTCGISSMAKYNLEENWDLPVDGLQMYYLDLLNNRSVSNLVADRLGVIHRSPQVILLHNGEVVYHSSHHMISVPALKNALEQTV